MQPAVVEPGQDIPAKEPPAGPGQMRPHHVVVGRLEIAFPRIILMVAQTDENVALAKKALAASTSAPDESRNRPVARR